MLVTDAADKLLLTTGRHSVAKLLEHTAEKVDTDFDWLLWVTSHDWIRMGYRQMSRE